MAHDVRGVIARGKGQPVSIETVIVPDPGPGEALVAVQACGVCHTDLHYREGVINDDFPFLLGHEAAGVVESVGPGVTEVEPGDYVILNWRAVCGRCRACLRGQPWYCFATHNATQKMTLLDGTELSPALGIGAFADKTLVAAGQCTPVDPAATPEVAGLLGCGVMAGLGAALHTGDVQRGDTVEAVRAATGGFGADVCVEAVGHPAVLEQAFFARDLAGTVVQVGVPTPDMRFPDIPMIEFFGRGGALKPSWYGDCLPSRDFPMLINLYLQGRFDLERFVSETIPLDGVEEAFGRMEKGDVLRSVVLLDRPAAGDPGGAGVAAAATSDVT